MLIDAMGLILADHEKVNLAELTDPRALAAVPICGRFRLVDFPLSSMVNSGIKNVGVLTFTKYKSLMDHLGTGLFWDLDRMQQGLTIIPPFMASRARRNPDNSGDLTGLYEFLLAAREEFVVISAGNIVATMHVDELVLEHAASGADMTVLYRQDSADTGREASDMSIALSNGYVSDLVLGNWAFSTGIRALPILILNRKLLIDIIANSMSRGDHSFSIENLLKLYDTYRIRAVEYKEVCLEITSLASYFSANMQLLEDDIRTHIFDQEERPIYTKVKNEAPAYFERDSYVSNSLVSDGCNIYGSVSNCILFRGVHVGKHANLHNCIIFQDSFIAEGSDLSHVILDKNTLIQAGVKLQGQHAYPVVIEKGARV